MSNQTSIVFNNVYFSWPDGTPVFNNLTGAFSSTSTGLIAANGTGKTTLINLITGHLHPTSGTITTTGTVDYLQQNITRSTNTTADLLGIAPLRQALRSIENGSTNPQDFDTIGHQWDIEERAIAQLTELGLPAELDRPVTTLSGGEATLTALTGVRLRNADIALLDEPTNNLDITSRHQLYDIVRSWKGPLIVASHDTELLDLLTETVELHNNSLTFFGGPYSQYRTWLEGQQRAAAQNLRTAKQKLTREKHERQKAEERISHSQRQGRKDRKNRKYVPAVINDRRNSAEKSHGTRRQQSQNKIDAAQDAVRDAERLVRRDESVDIDLPDLAIPHGKNIVELQSADGRNHMMQGPERIGLIGANGVGKTTLLKTLLPKTHVHTGYLPQQILFDEHRNSIDIVRHVAPNASPAELRNRLARLLIRGTMCDRPVWTLSGGERFRVALARLLLAEPAPELLILDEPTNNLDIASVDQLVSALTQYCGALLVVSHDKRFLGRLKLDALLRLHDSGVLSNENI